jgi:hypothetical protein
MLLNSFTRLQTIVQRFANRNHSQDFSHRKDEQVVDPDFGKHDAVCLSPDEDSWQGQEYSPFETSRGRLDMTRIKNYSALNKDRFILSLIKISLPRI